MRSGTRYLKIALILFVAVQAAVFHTYRGNTIGQLYSCNEGRIGATTVVFDTRGTV